MGDVDEAEEALRFAFDEYNVDRNGRMTRKEFFTFLWDLKLGVNQRLNEGQMLSCWQHLDKENRGFLEFDVFRDSLEDLYDHDFFAQENGLDPSLFHSGGRRNQGQIVDENYNTVKFKKSLGVQAFEMILQDEQEKKKNATAEPRNYNAAPAVSLPERPSLAKSANVASPTTAPAAAAPTARGIPGRNPIQSTPSALPPIVLRTEGEKEKQLKKIEAQKKMDEILAKKYQEQRRAREEERRSRQQEEKEKLKNQADALSADPPWMKQLKQRKASGATAS